MGLFDWIVYGRRRKTIAAPDGYVHKYPPFPTGVPSEPLDYVLGSQREAIAEITAALGLAGKHNAETANAMVAAPISHYAAMVHLLPASEDGHFKGTGGLFRFGLDCGLQAIRVANRRVLTRAAPEERKRMERLWTYAAFLAGLFSESVTTLSTVSVYSEKGEAWHPGAEPLMEWLARLKVRHYHITWAKAVDANMMLAIAGKAIPTPQSQYLAAGEKDILSTLISALHDINDLANPISRIVNGIRTRMIMKDLAGDATRYGKPVAGMHLAPWLVDSMRHLLDKQHWRVNEANGRVWYGADGVYLVWPLAAHDLRSQLKENQSPFVPSTVDILAEIMMGAGIIAGTPPSSWLFEIGVPQAEGAALKYYSAVRLGNPEVLFKNATGLAHLDMALEVEPADLADKPGLLASEATAGAADIDAGHATKKRPKPMDKVAAPPAYDDGYAGQYDGAPPPDYDGTLFDTSPGGEASDDGAISLLTGQGGKTAHSGSGVLMMGALETIPKDYVLRQPKGVTKIRMRGVEKAGLDPRHCIDTLSAAGLLSPVDGGPLGTEVIGGKESIYFLVKGVVNGT